MMFNTIQAKEIETIKERTITLNLSDADCERISQKAGLAGCTVGELLESFIGDLIDGTYSNGSDEIEKANEWYERCGFSYMNEDSLMRYLLENDYNVEDFLSTCDEIEHFKNNPKRYADEVAELEDGQTLWFEYEYEKYLENYLENHSDIHIAEEIELCRKWFLDSRKVKG